MSLKLFYINTVERNKKKKHFNNDIDCPCTVYNYLVIQKRDEDI